MYNNNYNIFHNHTATDGNVFEFYVDIIKVPIVIQIRRVYLNWIVRITIFIQHRPKLVKLDCIILFYLREWSLFKIWSG